MNCGEWFQAKWFRSPTMLETEAWHAAQEAMRERAASEAEARLLVAEVRQIPAAIRALPVE